MSGRPTGSEPASTKRPSPLHRWHERADQRPERTGLEGRDSRELSEQVRVNPKRRRRSIGLAMSTSTLTSSTAVTSPRPAFALKVG